MPDLRKHLEDGMSTANQGLMLRVFVNESDKHDAVPLYEWIVRKAKERGLAGATVLRAKEGFGASGKIRVPELFCLSSQQPIVIEIVDTREKINAFVPVIDGAVAEGLAVLKEVDVRRYGRA